MRLADASQAARPGMVDSTGPMLFAALARIVGEFAPISDRTLEAIAQGAPAGYITPGLATALLQGRQTVGSCGEAAI